MYSYIGQYMPRIKTKNIWKSHRRFSRLDLKGRNWFLFHMFHLEEVLALVPEKNMLNYNYLSFFIMLSKGTGGRNCSLMRRWYIRHPNLKPQNGLSIRLSPIKLIKQAQINIYVWVCACLHVLLRMCISFYVCVRVLARVTSHIFTNSSPRTHIK